MKKVLSVLLALVLVLTVFAACGGKESVSPGSSTPSSPGASNPYTTKWSIANIYSEITGDFWSVAYNGCMKALEELSAYGIRGYCLAPANSADPAFQIELINAALEKGVDGIVLSAVDQDAIREFITQTFTQDRGCPLVLIDHPLDTDDHFYIDSEWVVKSVMSDVYEMDREAGKLVEEALGGRGLYVMLGLAPSSHSMGRIWGALDYLEENAPRIKEAADIFWKYQNTEDQYIAFVQDQCSRHPGKPIAFLAATEAGADLVMAALAEIAECGVQRPAGDAVIASSFFSTDLAPIADGKLYGVVAHNPFLLGYNAVYALIDYLEGARIPEFIAVPYCVITKNNLESEKVKEYMAMNGISA